MSYKPDERDWMAYLYEELEGKEKEQFENYLLENTDARRELERYQNLRGIMSSAEDKEVIAPPIVLGDNKRKLLWDIPYVKTITSIAASFVIIMLAAKLIGVQLTITEREFKLTFGEQPEIEEKVVPVAPSLTAEQVQSMINSSLQNNNTALQANWQENQEKLTASIRQNLAMNSNKINALVREASTASQDQIREYVAGIQTENMAMVKEYFQMTSSEQKKYVENLLVDFAGYLQQQRNNDLKLVETRLNSLQQNTDSFKQETEQILTSIITTVGASPSKGVRN